MTVIDGRTRHYGDFYGIADSEPDPRPLLVVWGNCQAEALRILLSSDPAFPFRTVRIPPVHELETTDLAHVEQLMRGAAALISQPVRANYRSLPLGTSDIEALMPTNSRTVRWPVIRYAGLFPFQVIVRHPTSPSAVPAVVPYHDLRTIAAARAGRDPADQWDVDVSDERFSAAAQSSVAELERREKRDTDVAISDVLRSSGARAAHTINHPGNTVLTTLARRVIDALDAGSSIRDPGRELLGGTRAPVEHRVLHALQVGGDARAHWSVNGEELTPDTVHRGQMDWYARHPEFLDAAIERHAGLLEILGLPR